MTQLRHSALLVQRGFTARFQPHYFGCSGAFSLIFRTDHFGAGIHLRRLIGPMRFAE